MSQNPAEAQFGIPITKAALTTAKKTAPVMTTFLFIRKLDASSGHFGPSAIKVTSRSALALRKCKVSSERHTGKPRPRGVYPRFRPRSGRLLSRLRAGGCCGRDRAGDPARERLLRPAPRERQGPSAARLAQADGRLSCAAGLIPIPPAVTEPHAVKGSLAYTVADFKGPSLREAPNPFLPKNPVLS